MKQLSFKVDVIALFTEIINNNSSLWAAAMPLKITSAIMLEAAQYAIKLQDEKMIAYMARLGLYEGCSDAKHPDHKKLTNLIKKHFNQ